jgi:hypothetical protein
MAYVYRHIRLDKNQPFYIGIGSSKFYNRAKRVKNRNSIWQRIYDKTEIKIEIILDDLSIEEARIKEKEFIALYGRININTGILSNLTDGGEGAFGYVLTEEHRNKVSESNRRRIYTEEDRKNISIRHTGRIKSKETREKLSNSIKNSQKFKDSIKERVLNFKGFKHTEETKLYLGQIRKKKVLQKSLDGSIIKIWDSVKDAKLLGFKNISNCCTGLNKTAYGYKWEYLKI